MDGMDIDAVLLLHFLLRLSIIRRYDEMYGVLITAITGCFIVFSITGFYLYRKGWESAQDSILSNGNIPLNARGLWYIRNISTVPRAIAYHVIEGSFPILGFLIICYLAIYEYFYIILLTTGWLVIVSISRGIIQGNIHYKRNKEVLDKLRQCQSC